MCIKKKYFFSKINQQKVCACTYFYFLFQNEKIFLENRDVAKNLKPYQFRLPFKNSPKQCFPTISFKIIDFTKKQQISLPQKQKCPLVKTSLLVKITNLKLSTSLTVKNKLTKVPRVPSPKAKPTRSSNLVVLS